MLLADIVSTWSDLLKQPILTAEHCNGKNRIAATTEALRQVAHQFAKVLNDRAKLLANSAQFDAALRDAVAIVAILPGSGLGYLCMGDVYCEQGRYAAAISIYDQGLVEVPESDLYYQHLQQHRKAAIVNNNRRVDFISRLPLDIVVTNIGRRMKPTYYDSNVLFVQEDNTLKDGHAQLVRFAPYVRTLNGTMTDARLDELFSRENFSRLDNFHLECDRSTPRRPLINGLEMIARSLTHLSISECHSIQLRDILESCPNLVSLSTDEVDCVMSSSSSTRYPNMRHLALYDASETPPTHDDMVDVISRFPSLVSFEITPMPESSLLPILHEHCPYLQRLYYGTRSNGFFAHAFENHSIRKGITSAVLGGDEIYVQDHVIQFLHLHRHTLESFHLLGQMVKSYDALWELSDGRVQRRNRQRQDESLNTDNDSSLSATSFQRLVNICFLELHPSLAVPFMKWIILNAPNLTTISLPESRFLPDIASAMIQLKHLSTLEIISVFGGLDNDNNGIRQFLEYHIDIGNRSLLEHVIVHMEAIEMSKATWIPLFAQLQNLKNRELLADIITHRCKEMLEELGRGCHALEKLTLGMDGADMVEGIIKPLRQIRNLKDIRMGGATVFDSDLVILASFPRLEHLFLQCMVPDNMRAMLHRHIPKVEIKFNV